MKRFTTVFAMLGVLVCAAFARADLNYDPTLPAPAPILGAGWASDQIDFAFTDSLDSPYVYNLGNLPVPAYFRITDDFNFGDNYIVYDNGNPILTTALGTPAVRNPFGDGNPGADAAWSGGAYQTGEVLLAAGNHLLTVQGDGAGGLPAGFWTRIDPVPEPGTFVLAGMGLIGLAVVGWKRRK